EAMFAAGLVEEVRGLLEGGYSRGLPSMLGIGYREVCAYVAGEINLETAVARTKTGTHRLARHQNSWFKAGDARIRWIEAGEGTVDEAMLLAVRQCRRYRARCDRYNRLANRYQSRWSVRGRMKPPAYISGILRRGHGSRDRH